MELMLGTNPLHVDSDGDSLRDDAEYRPFGGIGPNPLIPNLDLLFIHGFERP